MDDKFIAPKESDFPQEIGNAEKFGIIEEEEKGNKKTWICPKCGAEKMVSYSKCITSLHST